MADCLEHAVVCLDASFDTNTPNLAEAFMTANGHLAGQIDELTGGRLPGEGWQVVSHNLLQVGERTLLSLILARREP